VKSDGKPGNRSPKPELDMDDRTIGYYQENADSLTEHYESADMSNIHTQLLKHLPEKGKILEIGCGSEREAAFLLHSDFDVIVSRSLTK
jgi:hypothetical protein